MMKGTEVQEEIIKYYLEGNSSYQTAKHFNISATQIRRILSKNNIKGRSTKTDSEIEERIIELYKSGINSENMKPYGIKENSVTILSILKRNGIKINPELRRKYKIRDDFLDNIDCQEKAYFLGFMFADGNVHKTLEQFKITLHNQDIDILYKFCKLLFSGEEYPIYMDRKYPTLNISNKKLSLRLNELGCVPNKTFVTKYPDWVTKELAPHFIRGIFDGDGCFSISNNKAVIDITGTEELVKSIGDHLVNEGIIEIYSLDKKKNCKNNIRALRINAKKSVLGFLNYIYENSTIHLDRKYNKFKDNYDFLTNPLYVNMVNNLKSYLKNNPRGSRFKDLTGQKFVKLMVESLNENKEGVRWNCKCDCGNMVIKTTGELKSGRNLRCSNC